jgi:hypothetical protein
VPLQALFLMNSDSMREMAGAFARRLCHEAGEPSLRIARALALAYCRPPLPDEVNRACEYVKTYTHDAAGAGLSRQKAESEAWLSYARTLLSSNEFVYVD